MENGKHKTVYASWSSASKNAYGLQSGDLKRVKKDGINTETSRHGRWLGAEGITCDLLFSSLCCQSTFCNCHKLVITNKSSLNDFHDEGTFLFFRRLRRGRPVQLCTFRPTALRLPGSTAPPAHCWEGPSSQGVTRMGAALSPTAG